MQCITLLRLQIIAYALKKKGVSSFYIHSFLNDEKVTKEFLLKFD
jgi:hypothetical protein